MFPHYKFNGKVMGCSAKELELVWSTLNLYIARSWPFYLFEILIPVLSCGLHYLRNPYSSYLCSTVTVIFNTISTTILSINMHSISLKGLCSLYYPELSLFKTHPPPIFMYIVHMYHEYEFLKVITGAVVFIQTVNINEIWCVLAKKFGLFNFCG